MSIRNLNSNQWLVRVRTRLNGQVTERKQVVTGSKIEARTMETALINELVSVKKNTVPTCSLKLHTFGDVLKFWVERTSAKLERLKDLISRLNTELGNIRNEEVMERFGDFLDALKLQRAGQVTGERMRLINFQRQRDGKKAIVRKLGGIITPCTRNHYLAIGKTAYAFAVKRGKLKENPLKTYEKEKETARDRVWTAEEKKRIFKVLEKRKSHLYWPVYFSAMNPIRRGDLVALKRENFYFNQFNPSRSYVHFIPQKTEGCKPREAQLICLDKALLDYFQGLPADCPLLFPRFDVDGRWYSLGNFKREWYAVLKEAKVTGMTWHDLKHCSITWMLDNGFSELDLKNLGIQYNAQMIARYYHRDADKARGTWEKIQENLGAVVPACGTLERKTA